MTSEYKISDNGTLIAYVGSERNVVVPNGVRKIGTVAFARNKVMERCVLPKGVYEVADMAFFGCRRLAEVCLPKGCEWIGNGCFSNCCHLRDFNLPTSVKGIGTMSFAGSEWYGRQCDGLVVKDGWLIHNKGPCPTCVQVPDGVIGIAAGAFDGCYGESDDIRDYVSPLREIVFPSSVRHYGSLMSGYCDEAIRVFGDECVNLTLVDIPACADFCSWVGLEGLNGGPGLTVHIRHFHNSIQEMAFCGSKDIERVIIDEGVVAIGADAFDGCSNLKYVELPKKQIAIDKSAFRGTKWKEKNKRLLEDGRRKQ